MKRSWGSSTGQFWTGWSFFHVSQMASPVYPDYVDYMTYHDIPFFEPRYLSLTNTTVTR